MLHKDSEKSSSLNKVRWKGKMKDVNSPREPSDRALRAHAEAAMRRTTGGVQTRALDEGGGEKEVNATMDATIIERTSVSQPPSRHALRNADPETARSEEHLGGLWELMDRAIDYWVEDVVFCYRDRSVSRFQEKEKRGEMITKNDNIK